MALHHDHPRETPQLGHAARTDADISSLRRWTVEKKTRSKTEDDKKQVGCVIDINECRDAFDSESRPTEDRRNDTILQSCDEKMNEVLSVLGDFVDCSSEDNNSERDTSESSTKAKCIVPPGLYGVSSSKSSNNEIRDKSSEERGGDCLYETLEANIPASSLQALDFFVSLCYISADGCDKSSPREKFTESAKNMADVDMNDIAEDDRYAENRSIQGSLLDDSSKKLKCCSPDHNAKSEPHAAKKFSEALHNIPDATHEDKTLTMHEDGPSFDDGQKQTKSSMKHCMQRDCGRSSKEWTLNGEGDSRIQDITCSSMVPNTKILPQPTKNSKKMRIMSKLSKLRRKWQRRGRGSGVMSSAGRVGDSIVRAPKKLNPPTVKTRSRKKTRGNLGLLSADNPIVEFTHSTLGEVSYEAIQRINNLRPSVRKKRYENEAYFSEGKRTGRPEKAR